MRLLLLLVALVGLSSCATSIPKAENFEQSTQKKMMAAAHWNALARDAVQHTRMVLSQKGMAPDTPLYLSENTKTVFDYAFRKYMIANFVAAGSVVSTKPQGAIAINYDTQVIKHAGAFDPSLLGYKPGMGTAAAGGFWVLRNVFSGDTPKAVLGSLIIGGGYDLYKANNPGETGVELLLTTSIVYDDVYIMHNTDAYYIEHGEAWLFQPCKGRNRKYCK